MEKALFYRCEKCGNIVAMVHLGGGELVCCGQPMTLLVPNSVDASKEKHVPVLSKGYDKLDVSVGSIPHPMTPEHFIEWIALSTDNKIEIMYLKPGAEPRVRFLYSPIAEEVKDIHASEGEPVVLNCEGSPCSFTCNVIIDKETTVYAYCNLHGLWKASL